MANYNPKIENLKPFNQLTVNEQRLLAKQGGKKSAQVRHEKRKMRDILQTLLSMEVMQDKTLKSVKEAMMCSVVKKAVNGDLKAVEWIQACIEEKPAEKLSLSPSPEVKTEVQMIIDRIITHNTACNNKIL